jgi:hypothetical protein
MDYQYLNGKLFSASNDKEITSHHLHMLQVDCKACQEIYE